MTVYDATFPMTLYENQFIRSYGDRRHGAPWRHGTEPNWTNIPALICTPFHPWPTPNHLLASTSPRAGRNAWASRLWYAGRQTLVREAKSYGQMLPVGPPDGDLSPGAGEPAPSRCPSSPLAPADSRYGPPADGPERQPDRHVRQSTLPLPSVSPATKAAGLPHAISTSGHRCIRALKTSSFRSYSFPWWPAPKKRKKIQKLGLRRLFFSVHNF